MKKALLTMLLATALIRSSAAPVTDTVSIAASYANQVWYSLENDEQGTAPKNNWDIAFDASGYGSSVMINSVTGTMVWKYPGADTAGWSSVDTTGMDIWDAHWNSDTSWTGAIGNYPDANDPYNLDWGVYNMTTHIVTGDSIYIVKLANGDYKKLCIISLASNVYTFKYADLDGSNEQLQTLDKTVYNSKNFAYYSMQNDAVLDREPASAGWDLVFTQHTAFIPSAYTVTGVLANEGTEIAKVSDVPDKDTYTDYNSATFSTKINTIGYNWKSFNGTGYDIQDSLLYFVKTAGGDIWKVIFTGFGDSADGNYIFSKEKLYTATSVHGLGAIKVTAAVYPNPASGQDVTIAYSFASPVTNAQLNITGISGRTVCSTALNSSSGLHLYKLPSHSLSRGIYVVTLSSAGGSVTQKLIIQ